MFFVLSKLAIVFLKPYSIVFLLALAALIMRKNKKIMKMLWISTFVVFYFFSNDFIVNEIVIAWQWEATPFEELHDDYGMGFVLGGFLNPELEPRGRPHLNKAADRIAYGVMLYHQGRFNHLVVSGGNARIMGDKTALEADATYPLLKYTLVPDSAIILENRARNTYENALYCKQLADSMGYSNRKHVLITSAFHMRRALGCYRKAGLEVLPFAVDYHHHERRFTPDSLLMPSADAMAKWEMLIKEWIGLLAYRAKGYL